MSNQDTQLKRMGLATLPRILCAFDVFDTHADGCRLPTHVLILGPRKGNKTSSELDLKNKKVSFLGFLRIYFSFKQRHYIEEKQSTQLGLRSE